MTISSKPILKLLSFDKPFEVQTNASNCAIRGILVQDGHPIAFASKKLRILNRDIQFMRRKWLLLFVAWIHRDIICWVPSL